MFPSSWAATMGGLNRRLIVVLVLSIALSLGFVVARSVSRPDTPVVPVIQLDRGEEPPAPAPDHPSETEASISGNPPPTVQAPAPPPEPSPPPLVPPAPPEQTLPAPGDDDDDDDDGPGDDDDDDDDEGDDDDDDGGDDDDD